jgi:xanthine dehydrogenase accessory factor
MTMDEFLSRPGDKMIVEISGTRGSTPREAGCFMLVSTDAIWGTVGGGNMEFAAVEEARQWLATGMGREKLDITLGPDTGQCCGGRVSLELRLADVQSLDELRARLATERAENPDVFIFGAGHVGRALALALTPLPFKVTVIETRAEELVFLGAGYQTRLTPMPESAVRDIRSGGAAVILTHDHALDFLIGAEALKRDDLGYVGMIGSKTKRGVFGNHLAREGFDPVIVDRLVLPIGGIAVRDKRPEVIAALVAAELLTALLS